MVEYTGEVTEAQWAKIEPLLPKPPRSPKGGRRRLLDRAVFEGILWVLRSGARWKDLPRGYPSFSTCWRRLQEWQEAEVWLSAWRAFLGQLDAQGQLDWHEVFADGTFAGAKKGGPWSENQTRKGYEAYGGGRRPGCAFGSRTCLGVAARSNLDRAAAGADCGAAYRTGSSAQSVPPIDL